jgi:energy-coupling factor transporter ATP-binding protein EcfA2
MYLRSILIRNTGPIQELSLTMPFVGDQPKPLVIVGRNGSGKSTIISFIVNALLAIKQQVFEDSEIEKGKVYRLRSALGIHGGSNFYFARLNFDRGVSLIEWQLDKQKENFSGQDEFIEIDPTWQEIQPQANNHFALPLGELTQEHLLEKCLAENCFLFFPADRFEPPDWLNEENLSSELQLPRPSRIKGRTRRKILSRNRLKPTLEWLNSVIFDIMVSEHQAMNLNINNSGVLTTVRIAIPGQGHTVFNSIITILQNILCENPSDTIQLGIGDRNSRIIDATVFREGQVIRRIKDLMSLSAGESALFCMFASILRDADLALMKFETLAQISGIVVVDEADLHLHLSLQYEVLPRLITLFPKIQFIISVHAPMVALGLEKTLGSDGFEIRELPTGSQITPENYSEFLTAFDVFANTKKFQEEVLTKVQSTELPVLLLEGKTDALLITSAWEKLNPETPIPFTPVSCGIDPDGNDGGAETLRRCVEFLSIVTDKTIIALFDNDRIGNEQFNSLKKESFQQREDSSIKHHKNKPIHALLLPIPNGRELFVSSTRITYRYLSIEHFFSDELLHSHGLKSDPIIADSTVFEIAGSSKVKVKFAEKAKNFESSDFNNFSLIFDCISMMILKKIEADSPA